jgi:phospholipase A1
MSKIHLVLLLGFFASTALADAVQSEQTCLADRFDAADDSTTVAEVRAYCRQLHTSEQGGDHSAGFFDGEDDAYDKRKASEELEADNRYAILPHRPNYILPISYNDKISGPHGLELVGRDALDKLEVKFQVSIKSRLSHSIFGQEGGFYAAYTQMSWWQAYNSDSSAPFRETNYEPEFWGSWDTDLEVGGWALRNVDLGFVHQSNGRSALASRSWNRFYALFVIEKGPYYITVKPWYRIKEDEDNDDNPNIDDYLGYGELTGRYQFANQQSVTVMVRNNLQTGDNNGGVQIDYTFPLPINHIKGHIQYYNGYGESLLDYDNYTNRLSVGIMLTDWL